MASESVLEAIDRALADAPNDWRTTLARTLASQMDGKEANASVARELRSLMNDIAAVTPPEVSGVSDELRARRAERIAKAAAQ